MSEQSIKIDLDESRPLLPSSGDLWVVAGPCSAESEEQVLATARELKALHKVSMFRAGIWKPRTRPNQFEGVGRIGLEWLRRVREEIGLPTCVEVAKAQHVEEALRHGVDVLWVGARSTANPFSVQELADALRGVDIPLMVKNPISPDLNLWIGALERFNQAGVRRLIAVHRGFSSNGSARYRNAPNWNIMIQLKRLLPKLPVICDPSHIAGVKRLVPEVARLAVELGVRGLMIETHNDPPSARSDKEQQLTPGELDVMLQQLAAPRPAPGPQDLTATLQSLRSRIDAIDLQILETLSTRMDIVKQIGVYKRVNALAIVQADRWSEILPARVCQGTSLQLSERLVRGLFEVLHDEAIDLQASLMQQVSDKEANQ